MGSFIIRIPSQAGGLTEQSAYAKLKAFDSAASIATVAPIKEGATHGRLIVVSTTLTIEQMGALYGKHAYHLGADYIGILTAGQS